MKVIIVLHEASLYGANLSLNNLIEFLSLKKYTITIVSPKEGPYLDLLKLKNINYKIIPFQLWVHYNWKSSLLIKQLVRRVFNLFKGFYVEFQNNIIIHKYRAFFKEDINLIISNSSATNFGFKAAKFFKIRHIWFLREFLNLDYQLSFYLPRHLALKTINSTDVIFSMSKAIVNHFQITNKHCYVLYDAFEKPIEKARNISGNKMKNSIVFNFLIVGLIRKNKGQLEAIIAFHEFLKQTTSNSSLLIVGTGNIEPLHKKVAELGLLDKVKFLGYIENMENIYRQGNVSLVCSENEAMGRVTIESLIHGLPVIGKKSGGTIELIDHGKNGFLYNTMDEMISQMILLFQDHELRNQFSLSAKQNIKKYSKEKYFGLLENNFNRIF